MQRGNGMRVRAQVRLSEKAEMVNEMEWMRAYISIQAR